MRAGWWGGVGGWGERGCREGVISGGMYGCVGKWMSKGGGGGGLW